MTTRLPVTCAVKSPRLKNPMTSTMPAIMLSTGGSRLFKLNTSIAPVNLPIKTLPRSAVTETIDDDLRNDQTEAHRQDDRDGGHGVGDRRSQELQGRIRASGEQHQSTRH